MKELDSHTKNMMVKMDGWSNILTGLNRAGKDKRTGYSASWERMDWDQVEAIYACDDIAEKIVDVPIEEAIRKKPIFTQKNLDADFNKNLWDYLNTLKFWPMFEEASKWGRKYGAGFILFGIRDSQDPDIEVDFDKITSVDWFNKLHRWDMGPLDIIHDVSSPFFREPESYLFSRGALAESELVAPKIHRSRVVRFEGARLPERLYRTNSYFNDSVLNRPQNAIKNYNSSHDSLAVLMQDFSAGVFKMKNLAQLIGAGQDEAVAKRLQLIDLKRSMVKSIVVDADEDFQRKSTPLNGIKDALQKIDDRLVAASRIPHTILLGEGSTGSLSGSGESEQEQWDDYVRGIQNKDVKPTLMGCMKILLSDKSNPVTHGKIPEGFDITFPPLQEPSPKEKSEVYKNTAEGDQIYIQNNVLDPDEVAISRFSDDEFNQDTQIEVDIREKSLAEGPDLGNDDLETDPVPAVPPIPTEKPAVKVDNLSGEDLLKLRDEVDNLILKAEEAEIESSGPKFVQDHYHEWGPGIMTSGIIMQNDGTHVHSYWYEGLEYNTNPAPTGEMHIHALTHREGLTGEAVHFEQEIKIDSIEKEGSRYVLKDSAGEKVLGKFRSKKQAEEAKLKHEDDMASKAAKKGPELLPKDD